VAGEEVDSEAPWRASRSLVGRSLASRWGAHSRNAPCPCGSGLKYKRCCLEVANREQGMARFEDAVGKRISKWGGGIVPG
jgi:hypothetical protein